MDIKKVDAEKLKFFAKAYLEYFMKRVWSYDDASNQYLKIVGSMVWKYFDVLANVAKESFSDVVSILVSKL